MEVGHEALQPPGPSPCLSLPAINAWELGEGYNVAESVPGQGGVLLMGRGGGGGCWAGATSKGDGLSDPGSTDVAGKHLCQFVMIY